MITFAMVAYLVLPVAYTSISCKWKFDRFSFRHGLAESSPVDYQEFSVESGRPTRLHLTERTSASRYKSKCMAAVSGAGKPCGVI